MKYVIGILLLTASVSFSVLAGDAGSTNARQAEVSKLDSGGAARLATNLANKYAREHYDSAPFLAAQGTLKFAHGRWEWQEMAGDGKGDLQAVVSFSPNGGAPKVEVSRLVSGSDISAY